MKISLIIPNYNGKQLLEKNLPAVIEAVQFSKENTEIIIVDDDSTDDSIEFIKNNFPEIILITQEKNTGFAKSCNLGVEKTRGEIIVLLNSDVSPEKNFLEPLIAHFTDNSVFAVGCLEKSIQGGREILSGKSIGYFQKGLVWHDRALDQLKAGDTFWVAGGSGAFRKSIWQKLKGFDLSYQPFYWEDIDLSYRAKKQGYKVLFEPQSIVFHNHETTIGRIYDQKEIDIISVKNQLLFFWKNIRNPYLWLAHLLWLPLYLLRSLNTPDKIFLKGFQKASTAIFGIYS